MSQFWQERKIDMFKDGISVSGVTLKYLLSYLSSQTYFSLLDQANSDMYHLIRNNNTGGPSIMFFGFFTTIIIIIIIIIIIVTSETGNNNI